MQYARSGISRRCPRLLTGEARQAGANSIGDDVDFLLGKAVPMDDFLGNHPRIHDYGAYGLENLSLQSEKCRVFQIQKPQLSSPNGFEVRSPLQPGGVNAVPRPKNVATRNTIQAEHELLRACALAERLGQIRTAGWLPNGRAAKRPPAFRPLFARIKGRPISARMQAGRQTQQVGFSTTGLGIPSANETDVLGNGRFNHGRFALLNWRIPIREQRMAEQESSRPAAAQDAAPGGLREPKSLLYSINARIGGYGLDLNAHESLILADDRGFLGRAIGYDNRQQDISSRIIMSLRWHPVRLLSFLSPPYYYDAKKKYVDWVASRQLKTRKYDLFHGWAGNSLRSLRVAKKLGIPSVLEIPTWHRDKGKIKPREKVETSKHEREARFPEKFLKRLLVSRQQSLEEYDLADLLLVPSQCSANTFLTAGIPEERLFRLGAGVDHEAL